MSNVLPNALPRWHDVVNHRNKEWARDDDWDGVREVHVNTLEGWWTSVRNLLRPFRGVHKVNLGQCLELCEWTLNHKRLLPHQLAVFVLAPSLVMSRTFKASKLTSR